MPILKVSQECLDYLRANHSAPPEKSGNPLAGFPGPFGLDVELDPDLPKPGKEGGMIHAYETETGPELAKRISREFEQAFGSGFFPMTPVSF